MLEDKMNERIFELAEQAEQHAHEQNDKHGIRFKSEYDRKFAELILEECLKYIDDSFGDIDYVKFMIKRNFGVGK